VQMNSSPIIRTNQAHPVSGRDCEAATIAGLPEAVSAPQLNRAITRKAALPDEQIAAAAKVLGVRPQRAVGRRGTLCSAVIEDKASVYFRHRRDAGVSHHQLELSVENLKNALHAGLAERGEAPQIGPADADGSCP
jgi:hypothetical protein